MTDLMATIGMVQLKLKFFNLRRTEIIKKYIKSFKECKILKPAFLIILIIPHIGCSH